MEIILFEPVEIRLNFIYISFPVFLTSKMCLLWDTVKNLIHAHIGTVLARKNARLAVFSWKWSTLWMWHGLPDSLTISFVYELYRSQVELHFCYWQLFCAGTSYEVINRPRNVLQLFPFFSAKRKNFWAVYIDCL